MAFKPSKSILSFFFMVSPSAGKKIEKLDTDDLDEIEKIAS